MHTSNSNHLLGEKSLYLQQHAKNPVDWHPWSTEIFEQAKRENKLVLISIGYSSCHWCHVMENESFVDSATAKIMNDNFICIKVDREERPDIDQIYMKAVQIMTGSGGWPLNCFTLPDGKPIYGGTYFPNATWKDLLTRLSQFYRETPAQAYKYAEELTQGFINLNLQQHLNHKLLSIKIF
ncbi:MAG: thioredoxin domain-containing protein [Bacteroidetes bacterium]|nr:thioredoxin domain-containing protein [Bacteroidota bacterium]